MLNSLCARAGGCFHLVQAKQMLLLIHCSMSFGTHQMHDTIGVSAAYTGLQVDIDRIRADNAEITDAERKGGLIINSGRKRCFLRAVFPMHGKPWQSHAPDVVYLSRRGALAINSVLSEASMKTLLHLLEFYLCL